MPPKSSDTKLRVWQSHASAACNRWSLRMYCSACSAQGSPSQPVVHPIVSSAGPMTSSRKGASPAYPCAKMEVLVVLLLAAGGCAGGSCCACSGACCCCCVCSGACCRCCACRCCCHLVSVEVPRPTKAAPACKVGWERGYEG